MSRNSLVAGVFDELPGQWGTRRLPLHIAAESALERKNNDPLRKPDAVLRALHDQLCASSSRIPTDNGPEFSRCAQCNPSIKAI